MIQKNAGRTILAYIQIIIFVFLVATWRAIYECSLHEVQNTTLLVVEGKDPAKQLGEHNPNPRQNIFAWESFYTFDLEIVTVSQIMGICDVCFFLPSLLVRSSSFAPYVQACLVCSM